MKRPAGTAVGLLALSLLVPGCFSGGDHGPASGGAQAVGASPDPGPGPKVCGSPSLSAGPKAPPTGALVVPAGDDSSTFDQQLPADTTYWFAPGVHTLGPGEYSQIDAGRNDRFVGAPGAVLSGRGLNHYAFVAPDRTSTGVTVAYLTIEDFTPPEGNGAVNNNAWNGWSILHDTIRMNSPGAGVMLGSQNVLRDSCLTQNGEYGFQTYTTNDVSPLTGGAFDVTVAGNEISYNDTYDWERKSPGCGCSGGGKFWQTDGATVEGNYVHDNHSVGIWADTNDNGFTITGNYIAHNYSHGLTYELSYNAVIENNTFRDNAWGEGPTNPGFPTGAVYISESGGDARVPNPARITTITISHNSFDDNWSGVVLWEDSNRFCGSPDNTSSSVCTLAAPAVASLSTCTKANLENSRPGGSPDYYDLCRWKTQNVSVSANLFTIDPNRVPACRGSINSCGENALFSEYCSNRSNGIGWSPYCSGGFAIADAMVTPGVRNDVFSHNRYQGPWSFMTHDQGTVVGPAGWQAAPRFQDQGSTFAG